MKDNRLIQLNSPILNHLETGRHNRNLNETGGGERFPLLISETPSVLQILNDEPALAPKPSGFQHDAMFQLVPFGGPVRRENRPAGQTPVASASRWAASG